MFLGIEHPYQFSQEKYLISVRSVLHIPFCYYPDQVGGTEIYVKSLCEAQRDQGIESSIAAPGDIWEQYEFDGIQIYRYPVKSDMRDVGEIYNTADSDSAREFGRILDQIEPDIVHIHALTRGVSLAHLQEVQKRKIGSCFTYHTPTVSCMRGTMMLKGVNECDGAPNVGRCCACVLQGHGLPFKLGELIARFGGVWGGYIPGRKLSAAIQFPVWVENRTKSVQEFFHEVDQIVAVCQWVYDVLLLWGISESKINLLRHGLNINAPLPVPGARPKHSRVRLAYFGRIDTTKGLELLLGAWRRATPDNVCLDVFGLHDLDNKGYASRIRAEVMTTSHMNWKQALDSQNAVLSQMVHYDAVVIPSIWMETGPLVAYEAASVGVPVLANRIGGLKEIVPELVPGLLIEPSIAAWADLLTRLDTGVLRAMQASPRTFPDMSYVASEMSKIYNAPTPSHIREHLPAC